MSETGTERKEFKFKQLPEELQERVKGEFKKIVGCIRNKAKNNNKWEDISYRVYTESGHVLTVYQHSFGWVRVDSMRAGDIQFFINKTDC